MLTTPSAVTSPELERADSERAAISQPVDTGERVMPPIHAADEQAARHLGHLDVLRELLDGTTGE